MAWKDTHGVIMCIDCGVPINTPYKYLCGRCRLNRQENNQETECPLEEFEDDFDDEDEDLECCEEDEDDDFIRDGLQYDPYNGWYEP